MLEKEVIQSKGFRNIVKNDQVIGFQFKARLPYYRGIYLSQLLPGTVMVDGEVFSKETVIWNIGGVDYTVEEMKTIGDIHWQVLEPAVIKIIKDGGLSQGYHDLEIGFTFTSSYMPPEMQSILDPDKEAPFFMPEMGQHVNKRRLLIV